MKKNKAETLVTGFTDYGRGLDTAPELEIPDHLVRVRDRAERTSEKVSHAVDESYKRLYCDHLFREPPNFAAIVSDLIDNERFRSIFEI